MESWNTPLICEFFMESEADIICNIPPNRYRQVDKMIWRATTTSMFTVRSAYYMGKERAVSLHGEGPFRSGYICCKIKWIVQKFLLILNKINPNN
jgi:hypothetical protein